VPELTDIAALNLSISLAYPISCVVGAPGAGKTSQLVKAVAQLESEFHPDRILVLTPSRLAAVALRDQIALSSGRPSSSPRARSISSFAFEQLSKRNPDLKLLSGPAQQQLLQELVASSKNQAAWGLNPKALGLQAFTQELRDLLQVVMEFGLDVTRLTALAAEYPGLKLGPVIDLLPAYLNA
jgi:superfamily I DNA/RNA helicase